MTCATAGGTAVAVAGTCSLTAGELDRRLGAVRRPQDVESAVRGAHGSFHVIGHVGGRGWVRGSAFGARQVHHAAVAGVTVCADRARTLAWLTGAAPDRAQVAARLALPGLPPPAGGGAMWQGVHTVPPGSAVLLERDGTAATAVWWRAPEPELTLAEGAPLLREALRGAVAARVRPGAVVGADLSGGRDSTALCFLAAEAGARLVTATFHWDAPGNQDLHYARYAAHRLPGVDALYFPFAELPGFYAGVRERHDAADEPSTVARDRVRQMLVARAMRERGAVLRLGGNGADEILQPPRSYVRALLRRRPLTALRHTAGWRARGRWPLGASAALLFDPRSYPHWLARTSARLDQPAADTASDPGGWGVQPRLPAWASGEAAALVADLLASAAADTRPLSAERGQHSRIHQAREAGRHAALLTHRSHAEHLPLSSPFCDDAVVTACLSVRPEETCTPWTYKPLLTAAMTGIVPDHLLERTTKDHCTTEGYQGFREHRADIADCARDSLLAAAGLTDHAAMRRALTNPELLLGGGGDVEATVGLELWLRDLAARPAPSHLTPPRPEEPRHEPAAR
ncbi:asparagine synthase-related protein [Kitasatospora sp. cg17-2]